MNTHDRAERELDDWLTTAMATLDNALDDVLDLDAGLADARLPSLGTTLTRTLDDVLDLDAGLDHILPTPSAGPTPSTDTSAPLIALARFANDFCSLPPHVQLAARTWFPHQELTSLQSTARRTFALALGHARYRYLALALAHAHAHARDLAHDLDLDLAHDLARALTHDLALTHALTLDLDLDLDLAHDHDHALALDLDHALATASRELIEAVSRLEKAVTNVMGADLSQVDLHDIPLEGLRWSTRTRWPTEWEDEIRHNSIELEPGVYEIRYGGIDVNLTFGTST